MAYNQPTELAIITHNQEILVFGDVASTVFLLPKNSIEMVDTTTPTTSPILISDTIQEASDSDNGMAELSDANPTMFSEAQSAYIPICHW